MFLHTSPKTQKIWNEAVLFHGKPCSELALGVRVCTTALDHLGIEAPCINRLVCVSELDGCCVDAVQIGLHCTIGKKHLLFHRTGMPVFTVYDLETDRAVRMRVLPDLDFHTLSPLTILRLEEKELFTFENAHPLTAKTRHKVLSECNSPLEDPPQRTSGLQDSPDFFRAFDEPR